MLRLSFKLKEPDIANFNIKRDKPKELSPVEIPNKYKAKRYINKES